jgi:hypothetical protein
VATTTAGADLRPAYSASPPHHGYRLIRVKGDKLTSYTYDYDGDGARDATSSIPVGKLNVVRDGETRVVAKNGLNESLENAKVKIAIAEQNYHLFPDKGEIHRIVPAKEKGLVYEVLVSLPARSEISVTLAEKDSPQ